MNLLVLNLEYQGTNSLLVYFWNEIIWYAKSQNGVAIINANYSEQFISYLIYPFALKYHSMLHKTTKIIIPTWLIRLTVICLE